MNLFTRKAHTVLMCNIVVPFVCTGFLGIKTTNGIITGSTTDEAHEISLTASDTEPASQYGKGEENSFAFIAEGIEAIIDQQEFTGPLPMLEEENDFAFITEGVEALINQQEKAIEAKKEVKKVENKKTTTKTTTKKSTTKKTTSTTTKKEEEKSTTYEKPSTSNATGEAIANYAKKFKGLKYSSGKQSLKTGADCSGFTMLIYREFGISIPRTVSGQRGRGKEVSKSNLQKGDLVFFKPKGCKKCSASHVSIYIGGGQVVHETRPGRGVAITGIDGLSNIQFVGARRIINSSTAKTTETKKETKTDNTVNVTPTPTPNNKIEEKNENVNSVEDKSSTPTITPAPTETKQEVVADTPKVETVETTPTPKAEVKVENTPVVETKTEVTENSTEEGSN